MSTPVGGHVPVLLEPVLTGLKIRPDGAYVDCTFGRGGHSRQILQRLGPQGRLLALDRDPDAVAVAQGWQDERFCIVHRAFSELEQVLAGQGWGQVDGVLLDIGVSSPQLDDISRGFSFRGDAVLDMRMDTTRGQTVAQWLADAEERQIMEVIRDYGEERFAKQIASTIVKARHERAIGTTRQLAQIVATAVRTREPGQDPATRTFQAFRIFINREPEELSLTLPQALARLAEGGRLCVIAFHSLEDRVVKHFMADASRSDIYPSRLPLRAADMRQPPLCRVGRAHKADACELAANPRARSAVLRVAERTSAALWQG